MATSIYGGGSNNFQFRALFDQMWAVEVTALDFASVANQAQSAATSVTVAGVALGDAILFVTGSVDTSAIDMVASISAANTLKLSVSNLSGGAVDLASATFKILIGRPSAQLWP